LIIFRVVQGFSAGFIMTLVTTLCVEIAGRDRMGRMMSTVGIPMILGPILGPVIGAVIVQFMSWRYIFFVNVPIGIIAIVLMILKLPDFTPVNTKAKFDFIDYRLCCCRCRNSGHLHDLRCYQKGTSNSPITFI
jgi:MFS family permease